MRTLWLLSPLVVTLVLGQTLHAQNEPATPGEPKAEQQEQKADTPTPPEQSQPSQQPQAEQQPQPDQQPQGDQQPQNRQQADQPSQPDQPEQPSPRTGEREAADDSRPESDREATQDQRDRQGQQGDQNLGISTMERDGRVVVSTVDARLARIGLQRDDVIVEIDGQPVTRSADFRRRLIAVRPGARLPIVVLRGGARQTIYWSPVVAYRPFDQDDGQPEGYIDYEDSPSTNAFLGVSFNPRYPNHAVILVVTPGSPAEQAGLQPGDVIVRFDGQRIRNAQSLSRMVAQHPVGAEVDLQFSRVQTTRVQLGERPNRVEAARVPYEGDEVAPVPPQRDGRLFDGDGRLLDRRAPNR